MLDQAELALVAGAVAFWLYDAFAWLHADEVVFVRHARRWRAALGAAFVLGGRHPLLPGGLDPGAIVLRGVWRECTPALDGGTGHHLDDESLRVHAERLRALVPLQWSGRAVALVLFVGLPAILAWRPDPVAMLALVAALYGLAFASVAWLVRIRAVLGMDAKALRAIALDVLACPPFAANVARKASLAIGLPVEAPVFARAVLEGPAFQALESTARERAALIGDLS